ncbi:MAG: glycosyltransferase family 4 protein [Candidatus Omnitrophica bacterium]|nr:glycosyltransferase family 4 protein [Candidatus Omnitrophota bacterium]MDD5080132.1 glycosyltransferase family 4 protein [Candidatus Omnitrophota bacterium]
MKILLIHPHDIFSGLEPWTIRIVNFAREFQRMGHEVKLAYCPRERGEEGCPGELEGIGIIRLSRKVGVIPLLNNLRAVLKAGRWADIIHFQKCFHYTAIPALCAGLILNKPLHYDWDDWEEKIWYHSNVGSLHTMIFGNFIRLLERYIPLCADTISVSSGHLRKICRRIGVSDERICDAPVGADLVKFNPRRSAGNVREKYALGEKTIVLYLGQLNGCQYVEMFIEAARAVCADRTETVFLVVGQGYMMGWLVELADSLGISRNVVFTGPVEHELIPEYIAASDICVASFEDNQVTACKSPLKIAEYLASGKPIVASSVGEVPVMVNGAGILVRAGDPNALAEGIMRLIDEPGLRKELGAKARKQAQDKYNWRSSAENLVGAYKTSGGRK